jgi:hypothetical protein
MNSMNWLRKTAALTAALTIAGCSAGYTTGNTSSVLLILAAINAGSPLRSDVFTEGSVASNSVEIAVAVRFKNPNIETVPSVPNAVILERYSVRFIRSDGRGIEGVDVPYSFSGNITSAFDVKTSGTDPVEIEVVRAQAKLEPPLRNLRGVAPDSLGGALVVTMFAEITLHGRTISGQAVSGTGRLQIDFADYAD